MKPIKACLWRCFLCMVLPAGIDQGTAWLRCVLETVHDAVGGGFGLWRCFIPLPLHVPGRRRGSRPCDGSVQCQGCHCTTISPELLLAMKSARRLAISAARCSATRCLASGVSLVSPLGCRTQGLPSLNGGSVTSLCHPARSCSRGAHSAKGREVEVG